MVYQAAVTEILASAKRSVGDKTSVILVFEASGIDVDNNLNFVSFLGPPQFCVKSLMEKLLYLPSVRIPAQRILRKRGIPFDTAVE